MAETINRGPNASIGSLTDGRVEALDGPSVEYQGVVLPDPRYSPMNKDGLTPGRVPGFWSSEQFIVVDAVPSALSTTSIAAAQAPSTTQGVALTLVTAQAGTAAGVPVFAPGIPIVPFGSSTATTVSVIDFGFATGTTAANSSSVTVTDNTIFSQGQWLVIAGAGAAGVTNQALITQVASVSTNTTILFISPVAATALNNAPIGQGNFYGNLAPSTPGASLGPAQASAFAAEPYQVAGFTRTFDPRAAVARNILINSPTTAAGTTAFLVRGYDVYGVPMTELITAVGGTNTMGKKAFKYIQSIATQTAGTTGTMPNVSFGAGPIVGLNMRNNKWEFLDIFYGGGFAITNTGWTSAVTSVATNTTGDVRGTQNLSTVLVGGATGSASAVGAPDGVRRLTINCAVEQNAMLLANPLKLASLFGVTQA